MEWNIQRHWQEIVNNIKAIRKRRGLTQERLAAITGISTQTISRFEQTKEDIQLSTIFKILDCFGMSLESYSYSFKFLTYRLLIDSIKANPKNLGGFLHNADPGHPCYGHIAKGGEYSFPEDDNENKNEIYKFLRSTSEEIANNADARDEYPLILNWKDFCRLVYFSSREGIEWLSKNGGR